MKRTVRVDIPRNADELIELGEGIVEAYNADPTGSPLQALDMTEFATRVGEAKTRNAEAKQLRRDAETATQDRDDLLGIKDGQTSATPGTVLNVVTRVRDILLGVHRGNEQRLGDHGFNVDDSPKAKKGGSVPPVSTGSLQVTVSSANGNMPLMGATVAAGGGVQATTDMNGKAKLTGLPLGNGSVTVSLIGYLPATLPYNLTSGAQIDLSVKLSPMP